MPPGRKRIAKKSEELDNAIPLTGAKDVYRITWTSDWGTQRRSKSKYTNKEALQKIMDINAWNFKMHGKSQSYRVERG